MKNRNRSLLDEMLEAIYKNRPELFHELRKNLCRHEDAELDGDGELLFCPTCMKRSAEVPKPCRHAFADRHVGGWVSYCSDCGLRDERHEPVDAMDMIDGK